jgi:hypothetical protein
MQSVSAALNRRIPLGVRSFEVAVRNDARTAMAETDDVDHVEIIVLDQPVEMNIEEIKSCCRPPMTEQTGLDMFKLEGCFKQRIILRIDLPNRRIVRRAPNMRAFSGADQATMDQASRPPV